MAKQTKRTRRINQMKKEYRKLATTANRRFTLLEKLAENPEYSAVLGYAYANAMHDLESLTGQKRFSHGIEKFEAKDVDIRKFQALINTAREFVESPTSLKSGVDKIYGKRAKTINKRYGTNMTSDDMKIFFESALWNKLKDRVGSHMAMKVIGRIQKNAKQIISEAKYAKQQHKKIDFESMKDIDGLDVNAMLKGHDKTVVKNLAEIYSKKH